MHGVGLVAEVLQVALAAVCAAGARRIQHLTVAVVAGGHLSEESLRSRFASLGAGTLAAGASLSFEPRSARWACGCCGERFLSPAGSACPRCGEDAPLADAEPELRLLSIDVTMDEEVGDVPGHAGSG